jgi:hypothetical protein
MDCFFFFRRRGLIVPVLLEDIKNVSLFLDSTDLFVHSIWILSPFDDPISRAFSLDSNHLLASLKDDIKVCTRTGLRIHASAVSGASRLVS